MRSGATRADATCTLTAGAGVATVAAGMAVTVEGAPIVEARVVADRAARVDQAGELRLARLESLRALAALGVLAGHVWGVHHAFGPASQDDFLARTLFGGGFGVFVFFALSGYLLYRPLAAATLGDGARIDLGRYARNRVLRILPLYYVVVAVLLIVQEGGGSVGQWLRFATLTENIFRSTALTVDGPIWSLIVEIHFYALLPFVAFGLARLAGRSPARAAGLLVVAGLAGAALRLYLVNRHHTSDPRVVYSLLTTSFFFVPGMLLAVGRVAWDRRPELRLPGLLGSGDAWLLASLPVWALVFDDYARTPLAAVASFFVVGAAALPLRPGPLVRALDWRPLALVGVASYSLYLWHLPIVDSLGRHGVDGLGALTVLGLGLSLLAAFASYRFVEEPFLRLRRRWASSS
jgi:peptidoglycan/LPS O-acetylase OafA/YrhL